MKLREFIRAIRQCKTVAEERKLISKELALIRTAFKEGQSRYNARNVAKLLLMHMMGYPTLFAQIECVKMMSSTNFLEKRMGYLGLLIFVDDSEGDLVMMATNCFKKDLQSHNQYVVSLALGTLTSLGSADIGRSLSREICTHIEGSNPYLRKKAAACAARFVRITQEPDERFMPLIPALIQDRNHGVLLAGCQLIRALLDASERRNTSLINDHFDTLLAMLDNLVCSTTMSEHDISGTADPFLQSSLLRLLTVMAEMDPKRISALAPVVCKIPGDLDVSTNVGCALIFEVVRALLALVAAASRDLEATPQAASTVERSMNLLDDDYDEENNEVERPSRAVDEAEELPESVAELSRNAFELLGRMLNASELNARYAALDCLRSLTASASSRKAMKSLQSSVLTLLRDPDFSIRQRALSVSTALFDSSSITTMTHEFLHLLIENSSKESTTPTADNRPFLKDVVLHLHTAVLKYAPDRRWLLETLLQVFCLSDSVLDEVVHQFVTILQCTPELHMWAAHHIFHTVRQNLSQETVVMVACSVLGDLAKELMQEPPSTSYPKLLPEDIIDLFTTIGKQLKQSLLSFDGFLCPLDITSADGRILNRMEKADRIFLRWITCMGKLAARMEVEHRAEITAFLIQVQKGIIDEETSKRFVETMQLLRLDSESLRSLMAKATLKRTLACTRVTGDTSMPVLPASTHEEFALSRNSLKKNEAQLLLDDASGEAPAVATPTAPSSGSNVDLLGLDMDPLTLATPVSSSPLAFPFVAAVPPAGPVDVADLMNVENAAVATPTPAQPAKQAEFSILDDLLET